MHYSRFVQPFPGDERVGTEWNEEVAICHKEYFHLAGKRHHPSTIQEQHYNNKSVPDEGAIPECRNVGSCMQFDQALYHTANETSERTNKK